MFLIEDGCKEFLKNLSALGKSELLKVILNVSFSLLLILGAVL